MKVKPTTRLKYYRIRRNRAFFAPGKAAAENAGWFQKDGRPIASIPLGEAGDRAEEEALRLYHKLLRDRGAAVQPQSKQSGKYPSGSFGDFFVKWRCSDVWKEKKPRTREDYDRAWPEIEKHFAIMPLSEITVSKSEAFHRQMKSAEREGTLSSNSRHRILKIWRALLSQAHKRGIFQIAPIGSISNPEPLGCSAYWLAEEIDKLVDAAGDNGFDGMALAIRIGWETLLSPCDVRSLTHNQLKRTTNGEGYIQTHRQKTGRRALPYLTSELVSNIDRYINGLEIQLDENDPIILMRSGTPYVTKDTFSKDFRVIRNMVFENDTRTFKDIRRSGNLEADLGEASPTDRAELLANSLHKNAFLEATYTPPTVARGKKILEKRKAGRKLLKAEKKAKSRNIDEK